MNQVIVSKSDVAEFLSYCVSWGLKATIINKEYQFLDNPLKFIFKLDKFLQEEDYVNIKRNAPSFDLYTI